MQAAAPQAGLGLKNTDVHAQTHTHTHTHTSAYISAPSLDERAAGHSVHHASLSVNGGVKTGAEAMGRKLWEKNRKWRSGGVGRGEEGDGRKRGKEGDEGRN